MQTMDLKEIMAVAGKPGLFKMVAQTKNGMIVESLTDKKRMPVYASDKISNLAEISIYTLDKEVSLQDVLKSIYELQQAREAIDPKSDERILRDFFAKVLPDYDPLRVYASDIRKVLNWYNLLHRNGILDFTEKPEETEEKSAPETDAETTEAPAAEAPEKKIKEPGAKKSPGSKSPKKEKE